MSKKRKVDSPPSAPVAPETARRLSDQLLLASFMALAFLLGVTQIADTDIWWHLRTGELILERGEIPQTDWFTYTNPDSPWIDLHWGFQLMLTLVWRAGGAAAVILATATCGAATFALLIGIRRPQWSVPISVACLIPSLLLYAGRYHPRPEMLTQLLLVVVLGILFRARSQPRIVWLLPLVQLLWVNVHSLFILGWMAWGAFLVDALARRWGPGFLRSKDETPDTLNDAKRWGLISGLMLAANLMNPYGVTGLTFPLVVFTRISSERDFYVQHAGEFQSMGEFLSMYGKGALFTSLSPLMLVVISAAALVSFGLLASKRRLPLDRLLLFAAFGYLAWQANRNAALFALVGGWAVRLNLGEWSDLRPAVAPTAAPTAAPSAASTWGRNAVMVGLSLMLLAMPLEIFSMLRPIAYPLRIRMLALDEVPDWHAHDASRFLAREGMPQRVYAMHLGQAAVYLFHNGPQRKVFADPRLEVNTRETLQRSLDVMRELVQHDPKAEADLRIGIPPDASGEQELPALLMDRSTVASILQQLWSNPRWRLVYSDPSSLVFLSNQQADKLGLRQLSLSEAVNSAAD